MHSVEPIPRTSDTATFRFRRDQFNSGVSRIGHLRPGGQLMIEYDLDRFAMSGKSAANIVCHARVQLASRHWDDQGDIAAQRSLEPGERRRLAVFSLHIPDEATAIQLWFEARTPDGPNLPETEPDGPYHFEVNGDGLPVPEPTVRARTDARVDVSRVKVVEDVASKVHVSGTSGSSRLETSLRMRVQMTRVAASVTAWVDVHVFDATGALVDARTEMLRASNDGPHSAEMTNWQATVYQGSGGGSGVGVWWQPDAHTLQYRVYWKLDDDVFTDGVLHELEIAPDAEASVISNRSSPGAT
jgi:hypothetical protein